MLKESAGLNLALDYLPGSVMFDPAARDTASPEDGIVDGMVRCIHAECGPHAEERQSCSCGIANSTSSITERRSSFTTTGRPWSKKIESPFTEIEQHILLPWAAEIEQAGVAHAKLTPQVLAEIVDQVPDAWLEASPVVWRRDARRRLSRFLSAAAGSVAYLRTGGDSMPAPASFDYAILRVVPRVERQEFMNAGVIVFCLEKRYLAARIHLD